MKHYGHGKGWEKQSTHVIKAIGAPNYDDDKTFNRKLEEILKDRKMLCYWLSDELTKFDSQSAQKQPEFYSLRHGYVLDEKKT